MRPQHPTLSDLRKSGVVTSLDIVAAVDAYVRDPMAGPYRFPSGHSLDLAAAARSSDIFAEMVSRPGPKEKTLRTALTTLAMTARLDLP
ncbi:hypothetical protein AU375_04787 [Methylobacterium radiotolerans]|nr:hypothetical protein AU375_04787 [Methylobacterium radiotolerans]